MRISPYSPDKVLCYYDNWKDVYDWYCGNNDLLPTPITVSVDLSAKCNMKCQGCNAHKVLQNNKTELDDRYLLDLARAFGAFGVKGACLGGGGESTLNRHLQYFANILQANNVKVGMVSNGIKLGTDVISNPNAFDWIGVSVDAAFKDTWGRVHGIHPRYFSVVLANMKKLIDEGVHVTYKYLIRPDNVGEIYEAAQWARKMGCNAFHARPMAEPWFDYPSKRVFTDHHVESANMQLNLARMDFPDFPIFGVFSKLSPTWEVTHPFKKCWAIFATCVFQSNKKVGLCCDLRGCSYAEVGPYDPYDFFSRFWGSEEHRKMQDQIDVEKCSRCTFSALNRLFERGVIEDGFMLEFI